MEYRVIVLKTQTVIKVIGPFMRSSIYTVSSFLKPLINNSAPSICLDIDGLSDEGGNMIFYVGLLNAFKKEIKQAGGTLCIQASRPKVKSFFQKYRLDKMFNFIQDKQILIQI